MSEATRPELAGRADFLRLAGQRHSGDQAGLDAVLADLTTRPSGYAVTILDAALTEYLGVLRAMAPDPAVVQAWLDDTGMTALDDLDVTDD